MSNHNRERREIRKLVKRGLPPSELTPYQQARIHKHGKRLLAGVRK